MKASLREGRIRGKVEGFGIGQARLAAGGRALIVNEADVEAAAFWRRRGFITSKDDPLIFVQIDRRHCSIASLERSGQGDKLLDLKTGQVVAYLTEAGKPGTVSKNGLFD